MKTEEFLTRLRETPRKWKLLANGNIRNTRGFCPIEEVTGVKGAFNWGPKMLGVRRAWVSRVARAADDNRFNRPWRRWLLEACGLTE